MSDSAIHEKNQLRREARRRRQDPSESRSRLDQQIRQHLLRGIEGSGHTRLAAFLSFDGEPDLEPALLRLRDQGLTIALPVLDPDAPGIMKMREWRPGVTMRANAFGIREPARGDRVSLDSLDLVLLPLVAYDASGARLGMGGGYYDRWLDPSRSAQVPVRVGVAYHCQQFPRVPMEAWDAPMDAIVNEDGWFSFPL